MASQADVEQFTQANRELSALALAELTRFWSTLNLADLKDAGPALSDFMLALVTSYGEMSAAIAADYFDGLREAADIKGRFSARLADPIDAKAIYKSTGWALSRSTGQTDPEQTLGSVQVIADKLILQTGRSTILESVQADPERPRFARIPHGDTCAFCILLAARGAVYVTAETAGQGNSYHGKCDCTPTPFWRGDKYPDHYNPDAYMALYQKGRAEARSGSLKPVLAGMRETSGLA